jgi:hypothetical protein
MPFDCVVYRNLDKQTLTPESLHMLTHCDGVPISEGLSCVTKGVICVITQLGLYEIQLFKKH